MKLSVLNPGSGRPHERASRAGLCALTVMAKAPRAGTVKTRLSPPLTQNQAAELSARFLRDTAENIAGVVAGGGATGLVAYTPVGDEIAFEGLLPDGFTLLAQRGEGFGNRLLRAAEDIFACGYGSVCLIDGDSPTVPRVAYEQAVAELARAGDRIVLGGAADGGYYLIGLKRAHADVFAGIAWSTDSVYEQTLKRADEAGIEVVELPLWYDVDDGATLDILKAELLAGIAPGFAMLPGYAAQHTREFLMELELPVEKQIVADGLRNTDVPNRDEIEPGDPPLSVGG